MPVFTDPENAEISDLQKLLLKAVPADEHGYHTISHLAKLLKLSRWAVQKWIRDDKIPPGRAAAIVDIAEGRVSLGDFSRYVYKL